MWHIEVDLDRYFKWFDLYAYPCFYCCNYFAPMKVLTHIHADHINNRPISITIKKESNDDDGVNKNSTISSTSRFNFNIGIHSLRSNCDDLCAAWPV
jgi:hypothetical protein